MSQVDTPNALTESIANATDGDHPVPVDQRSDTIQFYASAIAALWSIAPAPALDAGGQVQTDDNGNAVWSDQPDLDALSDGEIESVYSGCVRRAAINHIKPGLLSGKAKSKIHGFCLDLYEDLAKSELKSIRLYLKEQQAKAADYKMVRDALEAAAEQFRSALEDMQVIGAAIADTVTYGNHKSITLKGGQNAVDFFTRVFPGVRGSKTEARSTAAAML